MFQRYTNPYSIPEKPQEVSVNMMDRAESKSTVEIIGESLQGLTRLALREASIHSPVTALNGNWAFFISAGSAEMKKEDYSM